MPAEILVNGQHLVLLGISGNIGDKNAVASIIVPINVPDLGTAFSISAGDVAAALGISGLQCTDRPLSQDDDGEFTVRFQFEGFNSEVSFEQAQEQLQLSWDPDFGDEPIQTHPKFLGEKGLAATYAWNFNEEKFAKNIGSESNEGSTGLSKGDIKTPPTNKLFGVERWLKAGGFFRRSYAVTHVPTDIYKGVGTLVDYPPDAQRINVPRFKNRRWLKYPPKVSPTGSAYRIEESYRLSGITNGSEAIIYDAGQLDE